MQNHLQTLTPYTLLSRVWADMTNIKHQTVNILCWSDTETVVD